MKHSNDGADFQKKDQKRKLTFSKFFYFLFSFIFASFFLPLLARAAGSNKPKDQFSLQNSIAAHESPWARRPAPRISLRSPNRNPNKAMVSPRTVFVPGKKFGFHTSTDLAGTRVIQTEAVKTRKQTSGPEDSEPNSKDIQVFEALHSTGESIFFDHVQENFFLNEMSFKYFQNFQSVVPVFGRWNLVFTNLPGILQNGFGGAKAGIRQLSTKMAGKRFAGLENFFRKDSPLLSPLEAIQKIFFTETSESQKLLEGHYYSSLMLRLVTAQTQTLSSQGKVLQKVYKDNISFNPERFRNIFSLHNEGQSSETD